MIFVWFPIHDINSTCFAQTVTLGHPCSYYARYLPSLLGGPGADGAFRFLGGFAGLKNAGGDGKIGG